MSLSSDKGPLPLNGDLHHDLVNGACAAEGRVGVLRKEDAKGPSRGSNPRVGFIAEKYHVLLFIVLLPVPGTSGSRLPADLIPSRYGELDVDVLSVGFKLGVFPAAICFAASIASSTESDQKLRSR